VAGTGGALRAPGENPAVAGPAGPSMGPYGAHHASGNTLARELPVCPSCRLPGCSEASPETGGKNPAVAGPPGRAWAHAELAMLLEIR
jgi:hypothetical protein